MPNGGSDNCETCWHNDRHEGKAGYGEVPGLPCRCVLRDRRIADPLFTYCANHPHHDPGKTAFAVGPVYAAGSPEGLAYPERKTLFSSPDDERIRSGLLALLEKMNPEPRADYASPTRFEDEVIRQLGEFREKRAVPGLRRVLAFPPFARTAAVKKKGEVELGGERVLDRQSTIGRALEALARILGPEALSEVEPFSRAGADSPGKPLEVYEKLARLRLGAVRALTRCGAGARPALELAAKDPVAWVAEEARRALA